MVLDTAATFQAAANLVNTATVTSAAPMVNVTVLFNGQLFSGTRTLTYKVKKGARNATAAGK